MATGQVVTTVGKRVVLDRAFSTVPVYTNFANFKVGTGTTTPTIGDTDLQTPLLTLSFLPGYPQVDSGNLQVLFRGLLTTLQGNGSALTEYGSFNTDASPIMLSRCVHTAINKTTSIQVIYVEKNKIA